MAMGTNVLTPKEAVTALNLVNFKALKERIFPELQLKFFASRVTKFADEDMSILAYHEGRVPHDIPYRNGLPNARYFRSDIEGLGFSSFGEDFPLDLLTREDTRPEHIAIKVSATGHNRRDLILFKDKILSSIADIYHTYVPNAYNGFDGGTMLSLVGVHYSEESKPRTRDIFRISRAGSKYLKKLDEDIFFTGKTERQLAEMDINPF